MMRLFMLFLFILASSSVIAGKADKMVITDSVLNPVVTVVVLYNGDGVPDGWIDSTTRPDITTVCNQLIATQSKEYTTPSSRSRCIIKVQE